MSVGFHGLNLGIAPLTLPVHIMPTACAWTICVPHVSFVNLADPGVARFLASQMKLPCRCSYKLPRVWKSSNCNNFFPPSNSSQIKFPENNHHLQQTVWCTMAVLSRAFSVLVYGVREMGVWEKGKKTCMVYTWKQWLLQCFLVDVPSFLNRKFCSRRLWMCLCV